MPITHNKNLDPLSDLLISCISAESVPHLFSIKGECAFFLQFSSYWFV